MGKLSTLLGRLPKFRKRLKRDPELLKTTANVARLVLDVTKESSDAFPPLKSAAAGFSFVLDTRERLDVARENLVSLDKNARDAFTYLGLGFDEDDLPAEMRAMYEELLILLDNIKMTVEQGRDHLKGLFGVVYLRKCEKQILSLNNELDGKMGRFQAASERLNDQLVQRFLQQFGQALIRTEVLRLPTSLD
ncbi:hypothetical protein BU17DRAFT_98166 [Hysterangium stoloniferum]|nr:hypothetical protein BU17DRAFT_98166 [Hysterangium stoloniferum]